MKSRRVLVLVLALTIVLGSFSMAFAETQGDTPATTAAPMLYDIGGHWGEAAIVKWSAYGIINGFEGKFRPDDPITRGEMAVILDNMMDYQVVANNTFYDVPTGQFYTDAVLKAYAAGIMYGNGIALRPTERITREEAAVILGRAFSVKNAANVTAFNDAASISEWAKDHIYGMQAKGYIQGFDNNFRPMDSVSRAELLAMINDMVKAYYTKAGTYTENVIGNAVIRVSSVVLKDMTVSENLIVAEGVAEGDATFDSVNVLGKMVIRGGGENSIYIIGDEATKSVKIEKIGDRVRVVIANGLTVREMEVSAGEEIIISGHVEMLDISAPGAVINVVDAVITSAIVSGAGSSIIVEEGSSIETITASAKVTVSGAGEVGSVTLYVGADGSGITTSDTEISVAPGVTEVTGGGGTEIPPGSTGINDNDGSELISVEPIIGGDGRTDSPSLTMGTIDGAIFIGTDTYTVSATPNAIEAVEITVIADHYITDTDVTISVTENKIGGINQWARVKLSPAALNASHTSSVAGLFALWEALGQSYQGSDPDDTSDDYADELAIIQAGDSFNVEISAGTEKVSFTITVTE